MPKKDFYAPFEVDTFSPKQLLVLSWWTKNSPFASYDGIIADGAIRSGKSMSMSLSFATWAMSSFNERNFALCGKTIASVRRNVVNDLKRMLATRGYDVSDKRTENCLTVRKNGIVNYFYLFGGTDERSQDLIQGITLAGLLLDEVALMPESFVNQATARCSVEGSKLWFNCNPAGSRQHWFKQKWINLYKKKRILYLHFTMDDNPSLSESKKERYRNMYVGTFYRRYIEGRWVSAEGVIYDMWDMDKNVYTLADVPKDYDITGTRYIAIDYGTTNPMVFLDIIDDGDTFYVRNEYYYNSRMVDNRKQKTDSEYGADFEDFVQGDKSITVVIDPSAESFRIELKNRGYRVKEADNTVLDGIRMTSTMIQKRHIKVLKDRCPNFMHEIESYVWDDKAAQAGVERPVKENDHAMDAMRYAVKTLVKRWRMADE